MLTHEKKMRKWKTLQMQGKNPNKEVVTLRVKQKNEKIYKDKNEMIRCVPKLAPSCITKKKPPV